MTETCVGGNKPTFRKLLQGGNDTLRDYKEFDPDTLVTQGLLDPSNESLDFVRRRSDNTRPKPVAIYWIENEFYCATMVCLSPPWRQKNA